MAYRAKVSLKVWKQHQCTSCAALFRYPMQRAANAQAQTQEAASQAAETQLANAIQTGFDPHPCPTCGLYQPEMDAMLRRAPFGCFFALLHLGLIMLVGLALGDVVPRDTAAWVAPALAVPALLCHFRAATMRPNADLERNRLKAQDELNEGKLQLDQAGTNPSLAPPPDVEPMRNRQKAVLAILAVALIAFPVCEFVRLARAWPLNERWIPPVVGAGDESTIYASSSISSIKGYWSAQGSVEVLNASELGGHAALKLASQQQSWGNTISAKSSEKSSSHTPWALVTFPDDASLEGKTMKLRLNLEVRYPEARGSSFSTVTSPS
jgi:hypothetical protein